MKIWDWTKNHRSVIVSFKNSIIIKLEYLLSVYYMEVLIELILLAQFHKLLMCSKIDIGWLKFLLYKIN